MTDEKDTNMNNIIYGPWGKDPVKQDKKTSNWIKQKYDRELDKNKVQPPRSTTDFWNPTSVTNMLRNEIYIGTDSMIDKITDKNNPKRCCNCRYYGNWINIRYFVWKLFPFVDEGDSSTIYYCICDKYVCWVWL